ncbi:hypothetical protein DH2020_007776 [Rehmannia glutinosa]|uniref:TMEM205-like domain-containing protein n=1 Tax=Rehmannia glutinosa TaxID=99300 RepID=A0ABR0TZ60_REHGL
MRLQEYEAIRENDECFGFVSCVHISCDCRVFEKQISNNDVTAGSVVIEFEKEDGNTKVSVSPQVVDEKGYVTNAKMEEAKDASSSSVLPEAMKHGNSEAVGKVKDTLTHTAHEMKESVKEAASDVSSKSKDKVAEVTQGAKQQVYKQGHKGFKGFFQRVGDVFPYVRMASFAGVLHLLGFAVAYGMSVWVTFASSYVLAGTLPRQQFAMLQSKIYPLYFKAMASSVGMALLGYLMMSHRKMFEAFNLMASLVMILVNLLYLEPRTTKVMFERMKKEKEEGRGKEGLATEPAVEATTETAAGAGKSTTAASQEGTRAAPKPRIREMLFRRLNSYSSLVNVVTLMSLTWHLLHLAQHLHAVC